MTPREAFDICSLPPLEPLTAKQLYAKRREQRRRREGAGKRSYNMTTEAIQDLYWLYDHCAYTEYQQIIFEALAQLAMARQAERQGLVLSSDAKQTLAALGASGGYEPQAVVDFALRYLAQELRRGEVRLDPQYHNAVESAPG